MPERRIATPIVAIEPNRELFELAKISSGLKWIAVNHDVLWTRESETHVLWTRESETHWELTHAGPCIRRGPDTYNDYYGFLTSLENQIKDFPAITKMMNILPDDKLRLVFVVEVKDVPLLKINSPGAIRENSCPNSRYVATEVDPRVKISPGNPLYEKLVIENRFDLYRDMDSAKEFIAEQRMVARELADAVGIYNPLKEGENNG